MTTPKNEMTLFGHLEEFRSRLFRAIIALLVGSLLGSIFTPRVIEFLVAPAEGQIVVLSPTEGPVIYFKVALLLGLTLSLPYLMYQLYAFVGPGLLPNERRLFLMTIPLVAVLFITGGAFTVTILIPLSIPVLKGILGDIVTAAYSLDAYLSFVTTLTMWMGLFFQTPLVIYILVRLGFVKPETLKRARKFVIFAGAVVSAIITPTTDPFTMLLVTGPFIVLYEVGLLLGRLAVRQRRKSAPETPTGEPGP